MTAPAPDASRTALAARLAYEMEQAEAQGFGTATAWLTRAETDLICDALRQVASAPDRTRLDFLDSCAAAMTARDGDERGWALVIAPDRLTLDALAGSDRLASGETRHASCRDAIDARLSELERARSGTPPDGSASATGRARLDQPPQSPTAGATRRSS